MLKKILKVVGAVVVLLVAAFGVFVWVQVSRFDASVGKVYDIPVPNVTHSTDPAAIVRGKHLADSIGGCAASHCHGRELAGGETLQMGPLGVFTGPNITNANLGAAYSDGEMVRVIKHGIKKDGRTVLLMPAQDINWLPDADVLAIVSYVRSVPGVPRESGPIGVKALAKVLDRNDQFHMDVARQIDHAHLPEAPPPEPTAKYGSFIARLCSGCHGEHLSGGPIPGAPPSIPIPLNITPDATGLAGWTFDDFEKLMRTAQRKSGKPLDPFMPVENWKNMDDTEMHALWAYLQTVPPTPFGKR
jgi:mono/diheme cytochrome c family protein